MAATTAPRANPKRFNTHRTAKPETNPTMDRRGFLTSIGAGAAAPAVTRRRAARSRAPERPSPPALTNEFLSHLGGKEEGPSGLSETRGVGE